MNIIDWILDALQPRESTSETVLYEHMASQSGRSLLVIYQPFDPANAGHWRDRGAALDFVLATQSAGKRVLDFGPGDGWPSLIIAPYVAEVVGVEGAHLRVAVCRSNAQRLGVENATFRYVAPGDPLPFPDETFDAVVAASSVEQTPDPRATLAEFYRVLRPGGRVRLAYEALGRYRDQPSQEVWLWQVDDATSKLVIYDRHSEDETVLQIVLTYQMPVDDLAADLGDGERIDVTALMPEQLAALQEQLIVAEMYTTRHPSGPTLREWLLEAGFTQAYGTHNALDMAGRLFHVLPQAIRPTTLPAIDDYLGPIAKVAVELPAPLELDPMITAVK